MAKRKPTALKILGGEKRPSRLNPNEPAAPNGLADTPEWLSSRSADIFTRLNAILYGMGIASDNNAEMLAMLASRIDEVERLTAFVEDNGQTYHSNSGLIKSRPEVAMRNEAMRHAQSLLSEFGLSPATRSKVSASSPEDENPFAAV